MLDAVTRTSAETTSRSAVSAVVVNWNGWRDTATFLASLLAQKGADLRIVVCDNGSDDDSLLELAAWIAARPGAEQARLHLLALPRNLGYAGGLNAGIAWARSHWPGQLFWLLNNDLHAEPGALRELVEAHARVPSAGLCGSVLLEWDDPSRVQAVCGRYRKWLGVGWHEKVPVQAADGVCLDLDYPVGASLLVSQDYLDRVGPMEESYFLYGEEVDWVERGRRLGYIPVVALRSRLRHKEGASTGSMGGVRRKSLLSERYGVVNRLRVTRKFWPWLLPLVWSSLLLVALDRLVHGEWARGLLVLRLMFSPRQWIARPRPISR
jgi:GT2 family glycosyltransferase